MTFEIIPKSDDIPAYDPKAVKIQLLEYKRRSYSGEEITEEVIARLLKEIPNGIEANLFLDPDGESDWMEVLCDGEWLALGYSLDLGNVFYYSYNPEYAGKPDLTGLCSGGQSPVEKMTAIQDIDAGIKAVEYFIRTGGFYPGIIWAKEAP